MTLDLEIYSREIRTRFQSLAEQLELGRRWKEYGDEEAGDELIKGQRPMVLSIARIFYHRARAAGLNISDLRSAGDLGLVYARRRYDYRKRVKFGTYAKYAIITHMNKEIELAFKRRREFCSEIVEDVPDSNRRVIDGEGDLFNYLLDNSGLNERERIIITLRFREGKTLYETAEAIFAFGYKGGNGRLTKERVGQIQQQALKKMKKIYEREMKDK